MKMKAVEKCLECLLLVAVSKRRKAVAHDVMAAILVFQNNETAAILVCQANRPRLSFSDLVAQSAEVKRFFLYLVWFPDSLC